MATRVAMRVCFLAAALLGIVGLVGPRVAADEDFSGRPAIFSGVAAASSIHETVDRTSGLSVVGEPVWANLADGSSTFAADDVYGRASVLYPGRAVTKGPGLVCGQLPASPPQQAICDFSYPLTVEAGNQPDVSVDVPQPLATPGSPAAANAIYARAHADEKYVSTDAAAAGFANAGVSVEAVAAHTRQAFDDKKNPALLTVTASSELKGISLMDGLVRIGSISTTSKHQVDGLKVKLHQDHVVVSGVTVAGQPAEIDEHGVSLVGAGQGKQVVDAINAALQQALAAAHTKIYLLGTTAAAAHGNDQPCGQGSAGGVQFYSEQDLSQVPQQGGVFFANITLGQACTDAVASASRVGSETGEAESGIHVGTGAGSEGTTGSPAAAAQAVAGSSEALPGSSPSVGGGAAASGDVLHRSTLGRVGRSALFERQLRGAVVSHRLDALYLAFTLAFVGLCLGARLLSAARAAPVRSAAADGP
jgi:hypothetical protein